MKNSRRLRWHEVEMKCEQCSNNMDILALSFNTGGQSMIDAYCPNCDTQVQWISNLVDILTDTLRIEFEEELSRTKRSRHKGKQKTKELLALFNNEVIH